ncbi:MAG: NAD(P)-dependent glycerol-3-phosphate dehydrogenase [Dehalococcoidia bacterium]|nr:NAD(P)-dependent glycerol-3-phosphate dehydrogenase [Dehalococcoidia bacterium]
MHAAAVIGPTAWGTTLAVLLARNGVAVTLLARTPAEAEVLQAAREHHRRLPGIAFPLGLVVTADSHALRAVDLVCFATPAQTVAGNAAAVASMVPPRAMLLSASKGIEIATGRRMSEVLRDALPGRPVAALSGPNLSREVAQGLPSTTVIASADAPLDNLRDAFHSGRFRVYTSADIVGVEFGGALKNIVAIAAGMVDALGYGDNAKAAIITRGLAEITRLGVAAGADPLTFLGLAGVGDLIATSYSALSRNRRLGELVAQGRTTGDALAEIGETAEGAATTPAALGLAERLRVEMPITEALHAILYTGLPPEQAVAALLQRDPKPERGATPA